MRITNKTKQNKNKKKAHHIKHLHFDSHQAQNFENLNYGTEVEECN
jgi:hypothetical protein